MPESDPYKRGMHIHAGDSSYGTQRVSPLTYSSVTPDEMRGLTNFVKDYESASPEMKESMIHKLASELCAGERDSDSDENEYARYAVFPKETEL